ncbi:MAG: M24 family metallopeptidase, partial [Lachnospiraceae bacterium]|nr:M24 family metallopeptidase [Lachnospiraceae bacterium]
MAITIKTPHEIGLMRESCKKLAVVHDEIRKLIKPGVSTLELDKAAYSIIRDLGGTPNFLHLYGYPATICASVNEVVVHGIPSEKKVLKEGDIISVDMGLIYEGYHSDAARTYGV